MAVELPTDVATKVRVAEVMVEPEGIALISKRTSPSLVSVKSIVTVEPKLVFAEPLFILASAEALKLVVSANKILVGKNKKIVNRKIVVTPNHFFRLRLIVTSHFWLCALGVLFFCKKVPHLFRNFSNGVTGFHQIIIRSES